MLQLERELAQKLATAEAVKAVRQDGPRVYLAAVIDVRRFLDCFVPCGEGAFEVYEACG